MGKIVAKGVNTTAEVRPLDYSLEHSTRALGNERPKLISSGSCTCMWRRGRHIAVPEIPHPWERDSWLSGASLNRV
jgi:hypothetical protein